VDHVTVKPAHRATHQSWCLHLSVMGCCNSGASSGASPKQQTEPANSPAVPQYDSEDTIARKKAAPTPRCSEATSESIADCSSTIKDADVVRKQPDELDQSQVNANGSVADTVQIVVPEPKPEPEPEQDRRYAELAATTTMPAQKKSTAERRPSSCNTTLQDYTKLHTDLFEKLQKMEPQDNWVRKKQQEGVDIYVSQGETTSFKAIAEVDMGSAGPARFLLKLLDVENRPKWDEMCISATKLESYFPYYGISYVRIAKATALTQKRDLCLIGRTYFDDRGGILVAMQSVDHCDAPVTDEYVRCNFIVGGYILRPIPNSTKWRIIWTGIVDPKGWIPSWVVNLVAWKQGLTLVKFKSYFEKLDLQS